MPARSLFTHHRSRPTLARVATACLVSAVLIGTSGLAAPPPVRAAGVIIQVTTTADAEFPADMGCSLRAAILAANIGGFAGYCDAGTAQADSIRFQLGSGTPQINVGSAPPGDHPGRND